MKKLTTIISVTAMMCAVMAALIFSIWLAVYGDSNYRFYKKEYQRYEVTEDLDMSIDHVMYVTEHMMNYLIGKEEELSVVTTVEGREQDFFNERDRLHMRDVRNLFLGGMKVGVICLAVVSSYTGGTEKTGRRLEETVFQNIFDRTECLAGHRRTAGDCIPCRFYNVFYDFS